MPVARGGPGACHSTNSTSGFDGVERSGPTTCRTEVAATGTRHCQTLGARHPHRSLHGIRLPIQEGDLKERDQEQRGCMRACGEVSRDDTSMSKGIVTWGIGRWPRLLADRIDGPYSRRIASLLGSQKSVHSRTSITRPRAKYQDIRPMRRARNGPDVASPYGAPPEAS
jgi:hypothetical protein